MSVSLFIIEKGYLADIELNKVVDFEKALLGFMRDKHQKLLDEIEKEPVYTDKIAEQLVKAVEAFKKTQAW